MRRLFCLFLLAVAPVLRGQVVINEVHYDPDQKTEPVEFIELHNAGSGTVGVGGWYLTGAVEFTFPDGATVASGGYLVVAQDPAAMAAKFGVSSLGPWLGRLANEGDVIELRDAAGRLVDEVDYQLGFPWPTVGEPPGYSIELMNPALDNSLGGHWRGGPRPTGGQTLIPARSTWRYFPGWSEPSSPSTAWRELTFDDQLWAEGQAPIGYGDSHVVTLLDMRYNYSTVYFRRLFDIADPSGIQELVLEAQVDDGIKVWINGVAVLDANMPLGEVDYQVTAGSQIENLDYVTYRLLNPGSYLRSGQNVIAILGANGHLDNSSDFWVDVALHASATGVGAGPTPGAVNAAWVSDAPPAIRQVDHSPSEPMPSEVVRVEAKVTDADGVADVTLYYQVVDPGSYIELEDPEYEADWTAVPMQDDGTGGDLLAGDSVYTATLPEAFQVHRRLVRYRIEALDGVGLKVLAPYADDPVPNFAYYVYGGVPAWTGAVRPGAVGTLGETFTVSSDEMNRLPAIQLIAKQETVEEATWFSRYGGDSYPWLGTLVYDGKVYDHVRYRARGGVWRYAMCKNMWKFDANRGHDFELRDDWGRKHATRSTKLNLGASIQQGDYWHRGEQGMFESVGFRLFNLLGVPAPYTTFVQLRIVDAVDEVVSGDQYSGDFWGVYLVTEQPNGRFLDEHSLPDANFYKMEGGSGELNNVGPIGPLDKSDLNALLSSYTGASDTWWRENWDLEKYYSYQAVVQGIHHFDISFGKNFFYYRHPETLRWEVIPWDLDLTWAHNMYHPQYAGVDAIAERLLMPNRVIGTDLQEGTYVMQLTGQRPAIEVEFQNRFREVRDLLFNEDEAWRLIEEYAGRLRGPTGVPSVLDADRAQWDYNPKMNDSRYTSSPGSKAGTGRFYQWPLKPTVTQDFQGGVDLMKDYVTIRSDLLDTLAADAAIPSTPTVSYVGAAGFPVNRVILRSSAFVGTGGFASVQWRIGEITKPVGGSWTYEDPWLYEVEAVWEGVFTTFQQEVTVPPGVLKPGHDYRARVRMTDQTGRASHWSAPVEFVAGPPDNAAELLASLRLTELMPDPVGGSAFEYVELLNVSGTETLNLEGAKFTDGIEYSFPAGARLAPGERALVVQALDFSAFRLHYGLGASVQLFGPYQGNLDNNGETLVLKTAPAGEAIVDFAYDNSRSWPVPAMGAGHALVVMDRAWSGQASGALDYPGNWRASSYQGGSPGAADPGPLSLGIVINEVAAHTDYADPLRPEYDSNDWIELVNVGGVAVDFADYYLSDDPSELTKWPLPAGSLAVGARVSFDEISGFHTPVTSGFGIDKAGEQLLLSYLPGDDRARVVDAVRFKGQENERSLGRYPDGLGAVVYPLLRTRDLANTEPLPGLLISEVMYHPTDPDVYLDNTQDEFIELWNPTASTVVLQEFNGAWRLDGGVSYTFPPGTELAPGATLVVVGFDPGDTILLREWETTYGLEVGAVTVLGPYLGKLSNRSERVGLEKPQAPDLLGEGVSWVVIDEVVYGNQDPWPPSAHGQGLSLHRYLDAFIGNAPESWQAGDPSPGEAGSVNPMPDSDADRMPDEYEDGYDFLDRNNPADALLDYDGDGLSNLEEYWAGTDPGLIGSALRIELLEWRDGQLHLWVVLTAGKVYSLEFTTDLVAGEWQHLQDLVPPLGGGVVEVTGAALLGEGVRHYRVVLWPNL